MAKTNAPAPAPAKDTRTPELAAAWEAFERGDVRGARRQAQVILAGSASEAAKADARDLLARSDLEPGVKVTLLLMALVLGAIVAVLAARR